jgi:hypothetical protein
LADKAFECNLIYLLHEPCDRFVDETIIEVVGSHCKINVIEGLLQGFQIGSAPRTVRRGVIRVQHLRINDSWNDPVFDLSAHPNMMNSGCQVFYASFQSVKEIHNLLQMVIIVVLWVGRVLFLEHLLEPYYE